MSFALEVFFDGSCPLCQREIAYYQKLDIARKLGWVDVSQNHATCPDGFCQQDLIKRFHVRTNEGQVVSGAAGFALMWTMLPGAWKYAGLIAQWWPMNALLELAYRTFLPFRPWLQRRARAVLDN